jgi:hypothetical protein
MNALWVRKSLAVAGACLFVGCAQTDEFHTILGSLNGMPGSKVEVLADVRVGSLQIRHVRWANPECRSGFFEHLELDGEIGSDSSEVVERLLPEMSGCTHKDSGDKVGPGVYLNSNGGTVNDGYRLGAAFRKFSVAAVVNAGQVCASACAFAFIGAEHRAVHRDGYLIFHSPYRKVGIGIDCSDKGQVETLHTYINHSLGKADGDYLMSRTMDFCSTTDGWSLNGDAARVFRLTNFEG